MVKLMNIIIEGNEIHANTVNFQSPQDFFHCLCTCVASIKPFVKEGTTLEDVCKDAIEAVEKGIAVKKN